MGKKIELTCPKLQEEIKDYVLLMLGAPVVKIELDESQLSLCVTRTCKFMNESSIVSKWDDSLMLMVAQEGALAQAKLILGRVRDKFGYIDAKGVKSKSKSSVTTNCVPLDGKQLLSEGENDYYNWQLKVFGKKVIEPSSKD